MTPVCNRTRAAAIVEYSALFAASVVVAFPVLQVSGTAIRAAFASEVSSIHLAIPISGVQAHPASPIEGTIDRVGTTTTEPGSTDARGAKGCGPGNGNGNCPNPGNGGGNSNGSGPGTGNNGTNNGNASKTKVKKSGKNG